MSRPEQAPPQAGRERSNARAAAPARLEPAPRVLLVVDMINPLQFDGAQALARPALRAARAIAELKARLAAEGVPTVYVNDNEGRWHSDFAALVAHCRSLGGSAATLARRLGPGPGDLTVLKPRHSAFYGTPLELVLHQMATKEIVLTGVATDLCVMFTAMDAFERGFGLWVPADCTAAQSRRRQRAALDWMAQSLHARTESAVRRGTPIADRDMS